MRALENILLTTDFSENSKQALPAATALARRFGATLHLLHVATPLPWAAQQELIKQGASGFGDARQRPAKEALKEFAMDALANVAQEVGDDVRTQLHVVEGDNAAEAVDGVVQEHKIDLVVIATRGQSGLKRFMLGSTAEKVVRTAPCPVLVAREPSVAWDSISRILVPTDFSEPSALALDEAIELAQPDGTEILLVHVLSDTDIPTGHVLKGQGLLDLEEQTKKAVGRRLEQILAEKTNTPDSTRVASVIGVPSATIADMAAQEAADLIVIASRGRTGLARFMIGSTAERVVRIAPCSVLVVKERDR